MGIDSLGLHRGHDLLDVRHLGGVRLAILVENCAVDAHQVYAVFGEEPRALAKGVAFEIIRRAVHRPESNGLTVGAVNELPVLRDDPAVLTRNPLI